MRALRGPNLWSRHTAIEAVVTCDAAERDLRATPAFEQRLRELFPSVGALHANKPSVPISLAHALELTALALQAEAGCPVTFSRTTPTEVAGTFQVAVQYTEETVGRLAFDKAQALCRAAAEGGAFDTAAALAELRELDEDERLGPSTGAIVDAAIARGIPIKRLTSGSLVQLGWGSRQRRIQAAEVDGTSAIAESIAQDKDLTKKLLHSAGVPVPMGRPAADLEDAWAAALDIGFPVVLKPQDGNQGKGVTVGITERAQLDAAYQAAARYGGVMVEKYLPGHDFRLLVVGNQLVAAARREPPQVLGDDIHTVREEWGPAHFPLTVGHEIAGTVLEVGAEVTRHSVGDRVGVGCLVDSCGECEPCKDGMEMFCTKPSVGTYNSKGYDGEWTMGGYAQEVVVSERMVLRIPDALELDVAAPLLCAGITTYSPLRRWGAGTGRSVAVVGVGGLGHMGVKIAAAMGATVTTISRSDAKAADAVALGARAHIATSDPDAMRAAKGTFDIVLNTVSADIPIADYVRLLKPNGVVVNVGLPPSPYSISPGSLIGGNKAVAGSSIGGIAETQEMLDFCAEHGIAATIEVVSAADVNEVWDRVVDGDVRYRAVIDTSTITPA